MKKLLLPMAAVVLLTGCSASDSVEFSEVEHIHNVVTDGQTVFAGAHSGLFQYTDSWELVGDSFDVMGFTINGEQFLASGHPGPEMDFPDPLGLISSADAGESWESLGLTGDVDFHFLRASEQTVIGVAANYGMLVSSTDGGASWNTIETTSLSDLSINPNNSQQVLISSEGTLFLTDPLVEEISEIETSMKVDKVVWFDQGVLILSGEELFLAANLESEFESLGKEFNSPMDISAANKDIVVRDQQGIHRSKDLGENFELIWEADVSKEDHSDDDHED